MSAPTTTTNCWWWYYTMPFNRYHIEFHFTLLVDQEFSKIIHYVYMWYMGGPNVVVLVIMPFLFFLWLFMPINSDGVGHCCTILRCLIFGCYYLSMTSILINVVILNLAYDNCGLWFEYGDWWDMYIFICDIYGMFYN